MMTGLGIVLGVLILVLAAIYGIAKLVLGFIGFVGGSVADGIKKVRKQ